MESDFVPIFNAAGGNRHPAAADWHGEFVAFGADRNVALWRPLDGTYRGVHALLSGHTDVVNAVQFLPASSSGRPAILSGSADKTIIVWIPNSASFGSFAKGHVLAEHKNAINTIAVCPGSNLFVSGCADAEVKIWRFSSRDGTADLDIELAQTVSLTPRYFALATALVRLDSAGSHVLAVAGTKAVVQVYVSQGEGFKLAASLTGHEGWIRSLAFVHEPRNESRDLLLASASQDKYIRLWRVHEGEQLPAVSGAASNPALGSIAKSLSNKAHRFEAGEKKYSITFEALLVGHEDWIFTAKWHKDRDSIRLLSASADSSIAVWEPDPSSGIWLSTTRLGEISAQKGATTATGSAGGFWVGLWSPRGDAVMSLGRTGGWRLWLHDSNEDRWLQDVAVTGHTRAVRDLSWAPDGSYLLTTGLDQTTRLFSEWKRDGRSSWHEFSRPQIHGYDLNCVDAINGSEFISGADEKLLRVFAEPKAVAESLKTLCSIRSDTTASLPDAANIPVLGLSNKAITNESEEAPDPVVGITQAYGGIGAPNSALEIKKPPFEEHLARLLLWPEIEKLYGHGYEISAAAVSHDGTVVATACRASSIDHAVIRLYEVKAWREIKPSLSSHSLTVTSIKFSQDDKYLLSVGRDRQCAIFERRADEATLYKILTNNLKAHSRMILDASWAPLGNRYIFATAGRDKLVKVWRLEKNVIECINIINTLLPVTAIAFPPHSISASPFLAYGLEDGSINVCSLAMETLQTASTIALMKVMAPSQSISQLAWRPRESDSATNGYGVEGTHFKCCELAAASEDSSVRIYEVRIE